MTEYLKIYDIFLIPTYLIIIYFVATIIVNKNIGDKPYYKYFKWGLFAKVFAGLAFCAVYLFYYEGGDTIYYYRGAKALFNMAGKDFGTFLSLLAGNTSAENFAQFDMTTGWPTYFRDANSFAVNRFSVPFYMLGLGSYLGTTIALNVFLYTGIWEFYKFVNKIYPTYYKQTAIALLFIPSVVFWGSGLLKDGYCFVGGLMIFVLFHRLFFEKKKILQNIILFIIWAYIVIAIRPFIFYTAFATSLIWVGFGSINKIKSNFIRTLVLPVIITIIWVIGSVGIIQLGQVIGDEYESMDAMLERAWVIQDDLRRSYYGPNSFDIGSFEPTISGILTKAPQAIMAGIYRPFIWEAGNPLMIISGFENIFLLLFTVLVLFKGGIKYLYNHLRKNPLIFAFFVFAITFAFIVGLTTANFGALVRYRIPLLPMFLIVLFLSNKKELSNSF
jgi:hypothetical protein